MTSQEPEPPLPASVGGPPVEHGLAGAHHRDGALEGPPWCKPSWSSPLTYHRACRPLRPNNYQGGSATPPISRQLD